MIVESDKTSNSYKISKHEYNKLLLSSIRDNYKKGDGSLVNSINKEAKQIAAGKQDKPDAQTTMLYYIERPQTRF